MHLDLDKLDILEFLRDYNEELDDATLAGLSQKDLEYRKNILQQVEEKFNADRKSYDFDKAAEIENLLDNLTARVRVVANRKRKDGRSYVTQYDQKKSELVEKQTEIEERLDELLKYAYLAGFPIDKGRNNYVTDNVNEEMDLRHIYLTEEAAIRFNKDDALRNQRDKARLDRSTTNANVEKFNNLYAYIQELVKERNQIRNELEVLNEKLTDLIYGDYVEGYESFVNIDRIEVPNAPDPNQEIKDIRDELEKKFEEAVKGVNTYGDIMKMSLEDIRLLEENLVALNTKNAFDKKVAHAKAASGSDSAALDIIADIENIQSAYRTTRKVTENIKGIKNASISQMRTAIKSNREKVEAISKEIIEKEENVLRINYILGNANENDLKKFAKANKREIIALSPKELKDKEKISKRVDSTITFYTKELDTAMSELKEKNELKGRYEYSLETYEKGKENIEKGILNGKYESLINSNANITVGMKKLEELRNGTLKFDRTVLKEATEGHTLDEIEKGDVELSDPIKDEEDVELSDPIEDEEDKDVDLSDPIKDEEDKDKDVDLGEVIDADVELSDPIPDDEDDELAEKKGDSMEKKPKERLIPKIKGKLPKAGKVLLTVMGVAAVTGLVYLIANAGTVQMLLAGYGIGKVIEKGGLTKKK